MCKPRNNRSSYLLLALAARKLSDALIRLVEDGAELTDEERKLLIQLINVLEA